MKPLTTLALMLLGTALCAAHNVSGTVTCEGQGVAGVAVSDGYEVVVTDANGYYAMSSSKLNGYVFYTLPGGYERSSLPPTPIWLAVTATAPSSRRD